MVRALVLSFLALAVAGCKLTPPPWTLSWPLGRDDAPSMRAYLTEDVALTLPAPPGYPETRTIVQSGQARYGDERAAFDAVLSLAPDRVEIVLTMPAGPRLATVVWDGEGITQERSLLAPENVPIESILANLFVAVWPAEMVSAALPAHAQLRVDEQGARTIYNNDVVILTVTHDPENPARTIVRNEALGYVVTLVNQDVEL